MLDNGEPHVGKPHGALMSNQGVSKKHGGAHGEKHESDNPLTLSSHFLQTSSLSDCDSAVSESFVNQDGGSKTEADEGMCENLPFLPELGTDCLDSYENAVVENNTEWLKARCKNFGPLEFDISQSNTTEEVLEFPVIVQSDSLSSTVSLSSANVVHSGSQGAQYATPYLTLSGNNVATTESPLVALEPLFRTETSVQQGVSVDGDVASRQFISIDNEEIDIGDLDINNLKDDHSIIIQDGVLTIVPLNKETVDDLNESGQGTDVPYTGPVSSNQPALVQNMTENLDLTTISIATDKFSNSTKILVDTSQGSQMYHLNISDLKKLQQTGTFHQSLTDGTNLPVCVPSMQELPLIYFYSRDCEKKLVKKAVTYN